MTVHIRGSHGQRMMIKRSLTKRRRWLLASLAAALALGPAAEAAPLPTQPEGLAWPTVSWPQGEPDADVDAMGLRAALDEALRPGNRFGTEETRALLVVHRGRVVGERYAEGFSHDSRFLSWSVAKSLTNALIAILVRKGELALDTPPPVAEWSAPEDPRSRITLRHLLTMTSGLSHSETEEESGLNDTTRMLYGTGRQDMYEFAVAQPAAAEPGTHWSYSTGTSVILAGIAGRVLSPTPEGRRERMFAFLHEELLDPIGMRSAEPEFDASGTFVGGAYLYATARDYARLGLLFLRDGVWDGRRILPEGWVDFSHTLASAPDNTRYGAQFWLNTPSADGKIAPLVPGGAADIFYMAGNQGQLIVLAPDKDLIIVRLGTFSRGGFGTINSLMGELYAAFPARPEAAPTVRTEEAP